MWHCCWAMLSAVAHGPHAMPHVPSWTPLLNYPQADTVEQQLKEMQADKGALQKEVMQLKLITAETEEANQQLRDQLTQTSKTLLREHSAHKATAAALSEANASLVQCKEQLAEAMQLLQSVTVELSILSSRYHHARQECRALRAARQQQSEQQHLQEGDQAQLQQQGAIVPAWPAASCMFAVCVPNVPGYHSWQLSPFSTWQQRCGWALCCYHHSPAACGRSNVCCRCWGSPAC
eukprot:GHRR01034705.1.p1 GENE.GHRR01034705.1~~GHRR01034705.1.p1  ORF type:complete len:235 (+),score=87.48 GHRR01034705.1:296-1000(+)